MTASLKVDFLAFVKNLFELLEIFRESSGLGDVLMLLQSRGAFKTVLMCFFEFCFDEISVLFFGWVSLESHFSFAPFKT